MPIYEFECSGCGRRFELLLRLDSASARPCPQCGQTATRVMSAVSAIVPSDPSGRPDSARTGCDRSRPCCGREEPCNKRPCEA